jgi:signal transduction histidine kinase
VKRIVERHGGSVWTQSVEGGGATFYFNFGPVS